MYLAEADHNKIVSSISGMNLKNDEIVLILIGEKNTPDINRMITRLKEEKIYFIGGVFPGIIHDDKMFHEGAIIKKLPGIGKPEVIKISNPDEIRIPDFSEFKEMQDRKKYTAIVLIDGMAPNIFLFLSEMLNKLGDSVHYFGGGAGYQSMKRDSCVFTADGFIQDAAVVALVRFESTLGVRHGWEKLMGPLVVTQTDRNMICEFNWENAFEVYKEVIEREAGRTFTRNNFFDIAKGYPLGLYREGCEDIGRATVDVSDRGEIICGGEIHANAVVNILEGKKSSLISAARDAAETSCIPIGKKARHCLLADCISRSLLLENDFKEELEAIRGGIHDLAEDEVPEGILTLGEISSYGEKFLEFHNLTTVVMVMYE